MNEYRLLRRSLYLAMKITQVRDMMRSPRKLRRQMRLTNYKAALEKRVRDHVGLKGRV